MLRICLVSVALVVSVLVFAADDLNDQASPSRPNDSFIDVGEWWNLTFAENNNPLSSGGFSLNLVEIVETSERRPSWIKIRYTTDKEAGRKLFGLGLMRATGKLTEAEYREKYEGSIRSITDWDTAWINLRYVVSATEASSPLAESPAE